MIFISLFFAINANAQLKGAVPQKEQPKHINEDRKVSNSTPQSIAKNNVDKLKKSLKLDDKQYKDLFTAFVEYETGVYNTNRSKLSSKDQFKKLNELNAARQAKLKKILSKEQYHAYIMSFP